MRGYLKTRIKHFWECWEHAQHHQAIAVVTVVAGIWTFFSAFEPFVRHPEFPKLPLSWFLVILFAALFFIVLEGSYRKEKIRSRTVTSQDWRDLATRFEKLPSWVRGEWYGDAVALDGSPVGEHWGVRDDGGKDFAHECERLCEMAGEFLLSSKNISLSPKVRSRSNHTWRWLYFLSEHPKTIQSKENSNTQAFLTIPRLPHQSSILCAECAAKEN